MGKKKVSSSEEESQIEEEYGSSYDEEMEDDQDFGSQDAPEVDRGNILNYESDSSDEEEGEEDSLDEKMQKQKEALRMNDTWGKTKKSYYKNKDDSDEDKSSSGDEDQLREAERL